MICSTKVVPDLGIPSIKIGVVLSFPIFWYLLKKFLLNVLLIFKNSSFSLFNENSIFEHSANYLLIHKAVQDTKYELRIGTDKEYEIIVIHKDYFYVSNLASQLSHLLHIDLYNPFEDYD